MISLIFAVDKKWLIGKSDGLPWDIKEEMRHFRKTTEGKKIVVGLSTHKSIGILPHRENYVIGYDKDFFSPAVKGYIRVLDEFFETIVDSDEEWMVIGGKSIYEQTYKYADRLYISHIKGEYEGDIFLSKPNFSLFELSKIEEFENFTLEVWDKKLK